MLVTYHFFFQTTTVSLHLAQSWKSRPGRRKNIDKCPSSCLLFPFIHPLINSDTHRTNIDAKQTCKSHTLGKCCLSFAFLFCFMHIVRTDKSRRSFKIMSYETKIAMYIKSYQSVLSNSLSSETQPKNSKKQGKDQNQH